MRPRPMRSFDARDTAKSAPLNDVERGHILGVLTQTHWRIEGDRGAAELLNLQPSTLRSRMQKLCIKRPEEGRFSGALGLGG